jgi:hypothetical protein
MESECGEQGRMCGRLSIAGVAREPIDASLSREAKQRANSLKHHLHEFLGCHHCDLDSLGSAFL